MGFRRQEQYGRWGAVEGVFEVDDVLFKGIHAWDFRKGITGGFAWKRDSDSEHIWK